jgi:hypothetical protein
MVSRLSGKLALLTVATCISITPRLSAAIRIHNRCNSDFLQSSWALLKDARWGFSQIEHAAFAVRDRDGRLHFVRWPLRGEDRQAKYRGTIPRDAFAIVHTHPNGYPKPSLNDIAVAQRLGIPVYVVTRRAVSVTAGGEVKIITAGDWNPDLCK